MPRKHGGQTFRKTLKRRQKAKTVGPNLSKIINAPVGTPTNLKLVRGRGASKFESRIPVNIFPGIKIDRQEPTRGRYRGQPETIEKMFSRMRGKGRFEPRPKEQFKARR